MGSILEVARGMLEGSGGAFLTGGVGMEKADGRTDVEAGRESATRVSVRESSGAPHMPQKRNFSELSSPHLGQINVVLLSTLT